eukprot:COSAG06_NODE_30006_length_546_cov_3.346756_1_plen_55_part_10
MTVSKAALETVTKRGVLGGIKRTNRCRWPRAAGVRVTVLTQGYEQHDAPSHVPSS